MSSSPLAIHETHGRNLILPSVALFSRCRGGMIPALENPKLWRDRAEEAHKIAEELSDPISREMMFTLLKIIFGWRSTPNGGRRTAYSKWGDDN
jgi:hypothetical protein